MISSNVAGGLNQLSICSWDRRQTIVQKVRNELVKRNIMSLDYFNDSVVKFNMRITSICWHQKYPYCFAVGSKHGDISVGSLDRKLDNAEDFGSGWIPSIKQTVKGSGPGGSITDMKFDQNERNILYRTSIDSTVSRIDFEHSGNSLTYMNHDSYTNWFTAMDIDFRARILAAGDNRGYVRFFNLQDGKLIGSHQLHKSKVHHIEFCKRDPNIIVTAGLLKESSVRIWDIRTLNSKVGPLATLEHNAGVNAARFNPTDGTKLMTSDQDSEIRVYPFQSSILGEPEPIIINQYHRQFQHLTPIKAEWHPLADLIVIGKFPKNSPGAPKNSVRKSIELYNPENGDCVAEIFQPSNKIVSLNVFNPTGELLASGMSSELVIWRPTAIRDIDDNCQEGDNDNLIRCGNSNQTMGLSQDARNRLRGKNTTGTRRARRTREYSPVDDDDDENNENDKKTKRPRKVPASSTKTKTTSKKK